MASEKKESLTVRQEDEFEALQSIYSGDIVDMRKPGAWQVKRPPEMLISLRPQQSNSMAEAYARIDLYIKCPRTYPDVIPEIALKNPKGLSNQKVQILQEQLMNLAQLRVGEEMIYELCYHIESFLHDNNVPPRPSFYDEMINEQKRLSEEKAQEDLRRLEVQRQLEEIQFQELEEELKRKELKRKEDAKRMRDLAKQLSIDRLSSGDVGGVPPEPSPVRLCSRRSVSPQSSETDNQYVILKKRAYNATVSRNEEPYAATIESQVVQNEKAVTLKFCSDKEKTVHQGKCIGSSKKGSRVFVGMDEESGALVVVTQWEIHLSFTNLQPGKANNEHAKFKSQVASIESEVLSLVNLSHSNLVSYLGINHETKSNHIKINVLSEYVGGGSLEMRLRPNQLLSMDRICSYTHQALEGLAYLHSKGIIHESLRLSSFLLDSSGKLKMADYGVHKRLAEMVYEAQMLKEKEKRPSSPVKHGSKKDDIYQLGLLMLSLAAGTSFDVVPSNLPSNLSLEFIDFYKHCTDEASSWSASQLLDHVFIRTPVYSEPSASSTSFRSYSHAYRKSKAASDFAESDDVDEVTDNRLLQFVSNESRLKKEFKILRMIGSGGFGDVIKVRNILDNRCYAIKRISLNPAWHKQYKKLTREVEVLSKLNHENIVRYFNSWLEAYEDTSSSDDTSSQTNTDSESTVDDEISGTPSRSSIESVIPKKLNNSDCRSTGSKELGESGLSPVASGDYGDEDESSSESSESSDAELDVFGQSNWMMSSSFEEDFIVFEKNSEDTSSKPNTECASEKENWQRPKEIARKKQPKKKQYLYIQMEFCEKSTLRDCLDKKNLYKDVGRVWELFREIVEGLAHIHDQGIIHRDLKPVNIFLDSDYHVKIGDFGLATAFLDIVAEPPGAADLPTRKQPRLCNDETSLTGRVGTALYVSPEMESNSKRYNLKVDIYSLGIIFFEMCYRPMTTQMERIKILSNIRKESIEFPDDFDEICLLNQARIIRLLLNHDSFKRPSAKELLKSDYLPLSQMEEAELYNVLDSTVSNPEGRTYKHMLHRIFMQPVQTATDFLYDADLLKTSFSATQAHIQQAVASRLEQIFQKHSAVRMTVPLLMPTSSLFSCDTYVTMMDRSGGLVSLPYNMMVPFARFIARTKTLSNFKRYSIDRVYRECRPSGVHPRELWAASFDIVRTSAGSLFDDVETIYVVSEIIREFPALSSRSYRLQINHVCLVKAILLHCGIPDDSHPKVFAILGDSSVDRQIQREKLLSVESLTNTCVDLIYSFLQKEDVFEKISSFFRIISKTKTQAAALTKKGLHEIETVISQLAAMGCMFQPLVSLSLVSNIHLFSGILFQVMHEGKRKKKMMLGVLAAGGRYDSLVAMFRKPTEKQLGCPHAVGFSIAFDKVVGAAVEDGRLIPGPLTELLICAVGCSSKKELFSAVRHFWNMGITADVCQNTSLSLDEIKSHCHQQSIPYLLALIQRNEEQIDWTLFKMQPEKDRILKKEKSLDDFIEFFQKMRSLKMEMSEMSRSQVSLIQSPTDTGVSGGITAGVGVGGNVTGLSPSWNVTFVLQDGKETNKLHKNTRRAHESQIDTGIRETLLCLNVKNRVEVVATELPANVLKAFAAYFEVNKDEGNIMTNIGQKDGQKANSKKYVSKIIGEIKDLKTKQKNVPIIIYSLVDDIHRVLL